MAGVDDVEETNVIRFPKEYRGPISNQERLDKAKEDTESLMCIGFTPEGFLYVSSNSDNAGEMLLILESAKAAVLRQVIGEDHE